MPVLTQQFQIVVCVTLSHASAIKSIASLTFNLFLNKIIVKINK